MEAAQRRAFEAYVARVERESRRNGPPAAYYRWLRPVVGYGADCLAASARNEVFRAGLHDGGTCIVKMRPAPPGTRDRERAFAEAYATTLCAGHPHVVALRRVAYVFAEAALLIETAECASTLALHIAAGVHPSLWRAYARQLLAALAHVHARGYVHGDVKPDNVLVDAAPGAAGALRLCDFDSARALRGPRLPPEMQTGAAGFRAPETLLGHAYHGGVDVWAAAVTLCHAAASATRAACPFRSFSRTETVQQERHYEVEVPGALEPEMRREVRAVPADIGPQEEIDVIAGALWLPPSLWQGPDAPAWDDAAGAHRLGPAFAFLDADAGFRALVERLLHPADWRRPTAAAALLDPIFAPLAPHAPHAPLGRASLAPLGPASPGLPTYSEAGLEDGDSGLQEIGTDN